MTNDNNNINELVPYPDDDPTAEFEVPVWDGDPTQSDENRIATDKDFEDQTIEVLRSNLISSSEHVEKLQQELDDARTLSRQLEDRIAFQDKDVKRSDEEYTALENTLATATDELQASAQQLASAQEELHNAAIAATKSNEEITRLRRSAKDNRSTIYKLEKRIRSREKKRAASKKELTESQSKLKQKEREHARANERVEQLDDELAIAQAEINDLRSSVDQGARDHADLHAKLEQSTDELTEVRNKFEQQSLKLDEYVAQIEQEKLDTAELRDQLSIQCDECDRLEAEVLQLRGALRSDDDSESERSRALIAKQTGLISGYVQELRQLATRIRAAEEYADDLRQKMQVSEEVSERAVNARQQLEVEIAAANARIDELSRSLIAETEQSGDLAEGIRTLETKFDEETRRLRIELDAAQQTIAGQNTVNEQLLSDLYDNKGFRQALELQLGETEDKFSKKVRHLEQRTNRLRNQVDEYERKLKNKDDAIAALMHELANRSSKFEAIGEIENVIEEIDDQDLATAGDRKDFDRDRVTRLLVGNTEGQELRFPLFKDRLTIGRTANNDIQLNAQFISRRHAVIVTENFGTRIVDWGSKNGVFVNEKRIAEQILKNNDIVTIGTTDFRYEERPKR